MTAFRFYQVYTSIYKSICFSHVENVAEFKYLRKTVTTQNLIQKEIKSRQKSANPCYYSVQNFFVFSSPV
jgi:hypothetical protein